MADLFQHRWLDGSNPARPSRQSGLLATLIKRCAENRWWQITFLNGSSMLTILHTFSSSLAHPPPAHPAIDDNANVRSEILASLEPWGSEGIEFTNQRARRTVKNALQKRVAAGAAFMQLPGGQQRRVDRSAELLLCWRERRIQFLQCQLIGYNKLWSAITTYRNNKTRIISVRRSRKQEIEIYESL